MEDEYIHVLPTNALYIIICVHTSSPQHNMHVVDFLLAGRPLPRPNCRKNSDILRTTSVVTRSPSGTQESTLTVDSSTYSFMTALLKY